MSVAARAAVAVVAAIVLAWLAVMARDQHLQSRAVAASGHIRTAADEARAAADFRAARLLNPDTEPDVGRALLLLSREQRSQATAVIRGVLAREPDNLTAWAVLFSVARGHDPAAARQALAARARLDPVRARRR